MQSPALVRVSVGSVAQCGFIGSITIRVAGGSTISNVVADVLRSIGRKSGDVNLDEKQFSLVMEGQEVSSVEACFGPKAVELVRKGGQDIATIHYTTLRPGSPPRPIRRASVEVAELKEKLDVLLNTTEPVCTDTIGEEKWLEFGKEKKEMLKRLSKQENQLETAHNIAVLASEMVNLEHERLGQLRATVDSLQKAMLPRISWWSFSQLLVSGIVLYALFIHLIVPQIVEWVQRMWPSESGYVFIAIAVIALSVFLRAARKEVRRARAPSLSTSVPFAKVSQTVVHQSTRAEEQSRALTRVPTLRSRLPSNTLDDKALVRFLIARDLNVEKTAALVCEYLQWLTTSDPLSIPVEEVAHSFQSGKAFCFGMDKQKRPCVYVFARLHDKRIPLTETDRFQARVLAPVCQMIESGNFFGDEFVSIFDFAEFGMSNFDVKALTKVISNLDKHYCEQLGKLYLVNASTMFFALWKLVVPFIPERTKSKINIFKWGQDFKTELLKDFEPSQLLVQYGGTASFVYDPTTYTGPVINR